MIKYFSETPQEQWGKKFDTLWHNICAGDEFPPEFLFQIFTLLKNDPPVSTHIHLFLCDSIKECKPLASIIVNSAFFPTFISLYSIPNDPNEGAWKMRILTNLLESSEEICDKFIVGGICDSFSQSIQVIISENAPASPLQDERYKYQVSYMLELFIIITKNCSDQPFLSIYSLFFHFISEYFAVWNTQNISLPVLLQIKTIQLLNVVFSRAQYFASSGSLNFDFVPSISFPLIQSILQTTIKKDEQFSVQVLKELFIFLNLLIKSPLQISLLSSEIPLLVVKYENYLAALLEENENYKYSIADLNPEIFTFFIILLSKNLDFGNLLIQNGSVNRICQYISYKDKDYQYIDHFFSQHLPIYVHFFSFFCTENFLLPYSFPIIAQMNLIPRLADVVILSEDGHGYSALLALLNISENLLKDKSNVFSSAILEQFRDDIFEQFFDEDFTDVNIIAGVSKLLQNLSSLISNYPY